MNTETTKRSAGSIILVALVFGLGYSVLRYHVMGPVPWKDFPFFILNKGISLSAFVLLACNFGFGPLNNLGVTTVWTDPDFDAEQSAFYYARVIEIPTPRWSTIEAFRFGVPIPEGAPSRPWNAPTPHRSGTRRNTEMLGC